MSDQPPYVLVGYDGDLRATLQREGWPVLGYVAAEPAATELLYLGDDDSVDRAALAPARLLIAVDSVAARARLIERYGDCHIAGFVSAQAAVAESARIADTAIVQAGCLVSDGAVVEAGAKINLDARLHHHCRVGAGSVVAPGARLLGNVVVGRGCYVGAAATVRQKQSIGDGAVVGMGSVVVSDIPAGVVAYGNPATPHRKA